METVKIILNIKGIQADVSQELYMDGKEDVVGCNGNFGGGCQTGSDFEIAGEDAGWMK